MLLTLCYSSVASFCSDPEVQRVDSKLPGYV